MVRIGSRLLFIFLKLISNWSELGRVWGRKGGLSSRMGDQGVGVEVGKEGAAGYYERVMI